MKKISVFLLLFVFLCEGFTAVRASASPGSSASSAILYDAAGGTVLYEQNINAQMRIASTTKILTALIALENCGLDEVVEIKPDYTAVEGSSMYLKTGEKLTVRELLYGLMLSSGNDAAVTLACYTAGSVKEFANMMNKRAKELGCTNSSFKNPHGLDTEGHYSSAHDLALITAEAIRNNTFREISSTKNITIGGRVLKNHNKLLWSYDGLIGGKTGYTKASGRTLVTVAERDGMTLICVTLSDPDDWSDHTALYDWAYNAFHCVRVSKSDTAYASLPVISGTEERVTLRPGYDYVYVCPKSDTLTTVVEAPRFVYAGVIKGGKAGRIIIKKNGETVATIPLVYTETVKLDESVPLTSWEKLKRAWFLANSHGGYRYGPYYTI